MIRLRKGADLMTRYLPLVIVSALVSSCAHPHYDEQFEHHKAIQSIGYALVTERALVPGDRILLFGRSNQAANRPFQAYEDALITGLTDAGVEVVRLSDANLGGASSNAAPGPSAPGPFGLASGQKQSGVAGEGPSGTTHPVVEESAVLSVIRTLPEKKIPKLLVYHWVESTDDRSRDVPVPMERAYFRIIDVRTGVTTWSRLFATKSNGEIADLTTLRAKSSAVTTGGKPKTELDRKPFWDAEQATRK